MDEEQDGAPLRALVAGQYHLTCYVDMLDMPAFDSEVSAYSAIIIKREKPGPTCIAPVPGSDHNTLAKLAQTLCAEPAPDGGEVVEVANVVRGREPAPQSL